MFISSPNTWKYSCVMFRCGLVQVHFTYINEAIWVKQTTWMHFPSIIPYNHYKTEHSKMESILYETHHFMSFVMHGLIKIHYIIDWHWIYMPYIYCKIDSLSFGKWESKSTSMRILVCDDSCNCWIIYSCQQVGVTTDPWSLNKCSFFQKDFTFHPSENCPNDRWLYVYD